MVEVLHGVLSGVLTLPAQEVSGGDSSDDQSSEGVPAQGEDGPLSQGKVSMLAPYCSASCLLKILKDHNYWDRTITYLLSHSPAPSCLHPFLACHSLLLLLLPGPRLPSLCSCSPLSSSLCPSVQQHQNRPQYTHCMHFRRFPTSLFERNSFLQKT